jgi:FHS family L-fucose permease-like MFS transporter
MAEQAAEQAASKYNIVAMVIFCVSRFICTFLLKFVSPGGLLRALAFGGLVLTGLTIFLQNNVGLYCLVGISGCMSLMFPTIYGIALKGMQDDAKFAAAGLIMSIAGGSLLPMIQAAIIDQKVFMGMPAENASFIVPLICFAGIIVYGHRTMHKHDPEFAKLGGIPVAAREPLVSHDA